MGSINWSEYVPEIKNLSADGKSSSQILKSLKKKHGNIFPKSAERKIRKIVAKQAKRVLNSNAKILVFDIETAPMSSYIWGLWNQNISPTSHQLLNDWFIISWSAKWLFEDEIMNACLTSKEILAQNDERIVKKLWELIDESDCIISHNGLKFDEKKVNTRFLKHGLTPPSPYQSIDTLVHARKQFAITSNKLDFIARFLELDGKMETGGFELWRDCMNGDKEALEKMQKYNDQDILVLEEVYLKLRPWIKPHPNLALQAISEDSCCPVCTSPEREPTKTPYRTYVNEYTAHRCTNCGHIYRERKALPGNAGIVVSVPK